MSNYTTSKQRDFITTVVADDLLDNAVEWIKSNLSPEEIFDNSELEEWAATEASKTLKPEEVFDNSELEEWAESNDYVKGE